jgi:hypothetical protein
MGYSMLTTVAGKKKMFNTRDVGRADLARALSCHLGRPDEKEFERILRSKLVRNFPVTVYDARRAMIIYGPDVAVLKGRMTRSAPTPCVPTIEACDIPAPILHHYCNVTLIIDFFMSRVCVFSYSFARHRFPHC